MGGFIGCMYSERLIENTQRFKQLRSNVAKLNRDEDSVDYHDNNVSFSYGQQRLTNGERSSHSLSYHNDRYWILFEGEIYNHIELLNALKDEGHKFLTNSQTEVIVTLFSKVEERALQMLRGMFVFIIWDKVEKKLFGARDPFGIKPFYFANHKGVSYFASEKKRILNLIERDMDTDIDFDSLQHYLSFQYVPEPDTMTVQVQKLLPGRYFIKKVGSKMDIISYWKPIFKPAIKVEDQMVKNIHQVLFNSVEQHMRSDVPLGSFLTGCLDSSLLASIAKEINPTLKTFSVGYDIGEIETTQETAAALNVEHYRYIISPEEMIAELPKIIWNMDDPLGDPAAIAFYVLAREAGKQIKVALSSEGAKELFAGYDAYLEPHSLRLFNYMPRHVKAWLNLMIQYVPEAVRGRNFVERGVSRLEDRYIGNVKIFEEKEKKRILREYESYINPRIVTNPIYNESIHMDAVTRMQHLDLQTSLTGDVLLYADRMTMAHSLQLRLPFLDKHVFEISSKISMDQKMLNGSNQYLLRKAAEGIVPDHLLNRYKHGGFPVPPLGQWLKDELYEWAIKLIRESDTNYIFNKFEVKKLLNAHLAEETDNNRKLWTIFMFMIWHQIFVENLIPL